MGRGMKLGQGGRFKKVEREAAAHGAKNPAAIAAKVGMESLGKKRFEELAAKGRHRAAEKRHHGHMEKAASCGGMHDMMKNEEMGDGQEDATEVAESLIQKAFCGGSMKKSRAPRMVAHTREQSQREQNHHSKGRKMSKKAEKAPGQQAVNAVLHDESKVGERSKVSLIHKSHVPDDIPKTVKAAEHQRIHVGRKGRHRRPKMGKVEKSANTVTAAQVGAKFLPDYYATGNVRPMEPFGG